MNRHLERKKDFVGGITFIIFVAILIVGGFFLTRYLTSEKEHKKVLQSEIDKLKMDPKKDLVYYENYEDIPEGHKSRQLRTAIRQVQRPSVHQALVLQKQWPQYKASRAS